MLGEPTAPALRMISRRAVKVLAWPCQRAVTLQARPFSEHAVDIDSRQHRQVRPLGDPGLRNALAAFQRTPAFWLTWK